MDIRAQLLKENSKKNVLEIVDYIGNDEEKFADLMHLFLNDNYRVTQRAAWVLSTCADKKLFLVEPYIETMLDTIEKNPHVSITRNVVRILQQFDIPEELMGKAFDICLAYLEDKESPIAVKAFSTGVLYNICMKEPELRHEVKALIELQLPFASSGLKNRFQKTLKVFEKM